jgi:DNA-binding NarL/FixJ family response regulator
MARILSISQTEVLRTTRQLVLEKQGYIVVSLSDAANTAFARDDKFDLAIIGHGFPGQQKRRIANIINQRFPGLPILELCFHSPEIPGADFILSDSPIELVAAVREVLAGHRVRGFTAFSAAQPEKPDERVGS